MLLLTLTKIRISIVIQYRPHSMAMWSSIHRSYRSMGHEFQSSLAYFSFKRSFDKSFKASDQLFLIHNWHFFKRSSLLYDESMCCHPTVTVAVVIITKVKVKKHFVCLTWNEAKKMQNNFFSRNPQKIWLLRNLVFTRKCQKSFWNKFQRPFKFSEMQNHSDFFSQSPNQVLKSPDCLSNCFTSLKCRKH